MQANQEQKLLEEKFREAIREAHRIYASKENLFTPGVFSSFRHLSISQKKQTLFNQLDVRQDLGNIERLLAERLKDGKFNNGSFNTILLKCLNDQGIETVNGMELKQFVPPEKKRLAELLSKNQPTERLPFRNFDGELSPEDVDDVFVNAFKDPMSREELEEKITKLLEEASRLEEASTKDDTLKFKAQLGNQREGKNVKGTAPDDKEELELLKLLSQPPRYR
ncbi:MAG: hypothetical protein EBY16_06130 [Gammaproteobacteria bacterium]|nr:hypothetical protein [Gammaproteobacteria bacterium]